MKIKRKLEIATQDLVNVLNQKVVPPRYDRPLEFFIYLDEAHTLAQEGELGSPPSSALDIFNTVLGWLVEFPFFTIYISTTNLEPAATMPSISVSYPQAVPRQEPNTPFTELPFDVFARDVVGYLRALGGGRIFLEDMHSEQYLRKFGRPLWNSHCLENYPNKYWIQDELSAGQTIRGREDLLYACVGLTVQFDFDRSSPAARATQAKLVRSHLKIPLVVPRDGQCTITGYPSEPLLVEAASQLFPGGQLETYIPHALDKADLEGILAKDNRPQLVGRCIVILAQRSAVSRFLPSSRLPFGYMVAHGHPVPVLVLLNHMFNQKWRDSILNIRPVGDEHGPPLREAFKDVYVNFTHFAEAGDSKVMQYLPHMMLRFLMYGCCSMNSVDLITAMHHGSLQNPLYDSSTSQLAFQIQNCAEEVPVFGGTTDCYAGSKGPSCAVVAYAVGDRG
ncbi:uncharacterized protein EV420DRAFT_1501206 [Desarmillaria tabescens]|uniref:Uncharacterized protein n=1 Tax=Armillaria tabescens TaxID=1929756 RepID=A0AA39NLC7_ARMTA|nr:uncharacterized protein EV420DRAFT_1501206 [Desarmillaria tabescens]KAK0467770.1 hypothetical protein EV420DRAFT_1501206 [Desarmillaria tabescens]